MLDAPFVFQLSFLETGDTGVLSNSTGAEFIDGTLVSMKGCVGAGFLVERLASGAGGVVVDMAR